MHKFSAAVLICITLFACSDATKDITNGPGAEVDMSVDVKFDLWLDDAWVIDRDGNGRINSNSPELRMDIQLTEDNPGTYLSGVILDESTFLTSPTGLGCRYVGMPENSCIITKDLTDTLSVVGNEYTMDSERITDMPSRVVWTFNMYAENIAAACFPCTINLNEHTPALSFQKTFNKPLNPASGNLHKINVISPSLVGLSTFTGGDLQVQFNTPAGMIINSVRINYTLTGTTTPITISGDVNTQSSPNIANFSLPMPLNHRGISVVFEYQHGLNGTNVHHVYRYLGPL